MSLAAEGARGSACEEAGAPAVLYLSTTLLPVGAAATAIRTQLVFASVAALVLAFLLALVLAKGFSKPIEQLTRKAGLLSDDSTAESSEGVYEGGFCEELDRLSLAIDGAAADLAAAEGQLARVVSNLVDNAVSHVGEGGKVRVRLSASSGIVRLEVRDDGPGIPPEELGRVWERYFTKSQDKRNANGSGLGLAIAREILCAHGARYGVGNAQGGGAVFWFEMPASR